jgi:hypothetical protein
VNALAKLVGFANTADQVLRPNLFNRSPRSSSNSSSGRGHAELLYFKTRITRTHHFDLSGNHVPWSCVAQGKVWSTGLAALRIFNDVAR